MPIVTLDNAGTLTQEQKTALIQQLTAVVANVTHKPAAAVIVKIWEVPLENIGRGGVPLGSNS